MASTPLLALAARSTGLNRKYGLGQFKPGRDVQGAGPPVSSDPYASIIAGLPQPLTGGQITKQAAGMISPLVAAVTAQIGKQTQAATNAIRGYSEDAAGKLAGIDYGTPYATAESGQAAVDAALNDLLTGAGSKGAGDLSSRLAVINDPAVAEAAARLSANGAANGATQVAHGSAALGNLLAAAAAAKNYGVKLPGLARLGGLQRIAETGQLGQKQVADQTAQLQGQIPGLVQSLTNENDQRASTIASARQNQVARQDALAATGAKNKTAVDVANAKAAAQVATAQIRAKTAQEAADAKKAQQDRAYALQFAKTYGYDPVTNRLLPGYTQDASGHIVKTGKSAGAKGASVAQVQSFIKGLTTYETVSKNDGNGTTTSSKQAAGHSMNYPDAYKWLRRHGVDDVTARTDLAGVYKRGQDGRAWLTNEEQAVLKTAASRTAGPGAGAAIGKIRKSPTGSAYLTPQQVAILTAANLLPPGHKGTDPAGGAIWWINE